MDWSPIAIDCRLFQWFWLSHNRPQLWVLPMYRSSSSIGPTQCRMLAWRVDQWGEPEWQYIRFNKIKAKRLTVNLPKKEARSSIRSDPKNNCFWFFASSITIVGAPNAFRRQQKQPSDEECNTGASLHIRWTTEATKLLVHVLSSTSGYLTYASRCAI